jgi:cytochrome bd-type quinol oxidase subunit 1
VSREVTVDRLQFTLTVTYHYIFPILTMGLALISETQNGERASR